MAGRPGAGVLLAVLCIFLVHVHASSQVGSNLVPTGRDPIATHVLSRSLPTGTAHHHAPAQVYHILLPFATLTAAPFSPDWQATPPTRLLVKYKDNGGGLGARSRHSMRMGVRLANSETEGSGGYDVLDITDGTSLQAKKAQLEADPGVWWW
jgi:hypothetical protein